MFVVVSIFHNAKLCLIPVLFIPLLIRMTSVPRQKYSKGAHIFARTVTLKKWHLHVRLVRKQYHKAASQQNTVKSVAQNDSFLRGLLQSLDLLLWHLVVL